MKPKPRSLLMKISEGFPYLEKSFSTSSSVVPVGRFPTNSRLLCVYVFSPGFLKFCRSIVKAASVGEKVQSATINIKPNIGVAVLCKTVSYSGYSALQHQCVVHCCRLLGASSAGLVGGWAAVGVGRDSAALNVVLCFLASFKAHKSSIQSFIEDYFQNLRKILIQKYKQSHDRCCSADVRGFTDIAVSFIILLASFSEILIGKIYVGHTVGKHKQETMKSNKNLITLS